MTNIQLKAQISQDPLLQKFYDYLPPKPYCTDVLDYGLKIRPKNYAAKQAYIQPNPITGAYWLTFDIDINREEGIFWLDYDPAPNMSVVNRANLHEHLYYLINPAVYTLRQAHMKPLRLAADVERGLTNMWGGDPHFGHLIAKNPLHPQWSLHIWHESSWDLVKLIEAIPREYLGRKVKAREEIGLGRNCTVFEKARIYAYEMWRKQKYEDYGRLFDAVYEFGLNYNAGFDIPMTAGEVRCITRSVSKWTARHMDAEGFHEWGELRRANSIMTRRTRAQEKADEVKAFHAGHPQATVREMAALFDIPKSTVDRYLGR